MTDITGDWKGTFTFHMATDTEEYCARIVEHIGEHFIPREPMHRYLTGGVWTPEHKHDITEEVKHLLKEGLSFYVTPKNSDQIVGVHLMSDSRNPPPFEPQSDTAIILARMLGKVKEEIEPIFQSKYPSSHYAEVSVTSVHADYLGRGIATEMYERSFKLLSSKGFTVLRTDFSHPGTVRIGEKLGFEVLHTIYLRDQVDEGGDGRKIFPDAKEDEFVVHVAKKLTIANSQSEVGPERHILGDWKDFTFHMATAGDCGQIVQHLGTNFIPWEPLNKYLTADTGGVWIPEHEQDITDVVTHLLESGLSFYVTLQGSTKIIAVNLMSDSRRPEPHIFAHPRAKITKIMIRLFENLQQEADHTLRSQNVNPPSFHAEIFFTSVDAKHGGRGLATEMYERSLKFVAAKGFPAIRGDFSHPGTVRIAEKLGFRELGRFYLKDQVDESGCGRKLFPDSSEDEFAVHGIKLLYVNKDK